MEPAEYGLSSPTVDAVFGVIMLAVIIGFLIAVGSLVVRVTGALRQPVLLRHARVVGIRRYCAEAVPADADPRRSLWSVTFEFEEGSSEEFLLTSRERAALSVNGLGLLRSQGGWFRGFQQESALPVREDI